MPRLDTARPVFLDESGFDTMTIRRAGRSDRGTPCLGAVPHGRWGAVTFVAGLRVGATCAPTPMQGAMDGG
jgi:hypothetical protein